MIGLSKRRMSRADGILAGLSDLGGEIIGFACALALAWAWVCACCVCHLLSVRELAAQLRVALLTFEAQLSLTALFCILTGFLMGANVNAQ